MKASVLTPLALTLSLVLGACGGGSAPSRSPAAGAGDDTTPSSDTLVVAVQSDMESLISFISQSATDSPLIQAMFPALTGSEFDCRIQYKPALAETWEHAEDGLSITYHMSHDFTWSDGKPVTAHDVAFTYELVADPKVASPRINFVEYMKEDARPRVIDDYTLRFEFTQAYDRQTQMSHTGLEIMPKHVMETFDRTTLRGAGFEDAPVVSGPWTVGKWEKEQALTLVPNLNYTGPKPATLGRVIFKVVPEYATRMIELENGSVDMIENFQTVNDIGRIAIDRPDLNQYRRGYRFVDYLGWNNGNELFSDPRVRRALTKAINRQKLIDDLLTTADGEVLGVEAVSTITPELCDYAEHGITPLPYDPAAATAELAALGWKDTDADGVLDRNGKPFRFELLTNSGNQRRAKGIIIVQANLKAIGIAVEITTVETNNFFERLRKRDYEACLAGWSAGLFIDPTNIWHSDFPDHVNEFNFVAYNNPIADALIEKGMTMSDPTEVAVVWRELQAVIYADQPYTFLHWRDEVVPVEKRVHDPKVDILSTFHDMNTWWVPSSMTKFQF